MTPLEESAAEYIAERASGEVLAQLLRETYMAGAEHALRIAREPGGVDQLRQEVIAYGRMLHAARRPR